MNYEKPGIPHTLLGYLARKPGYKKALHVFGNMRRGENILAHEWDLCIILDACRADLLQSLLKREWKPPHDIEWGTIVSLDSATEPWVKKTFNQFCGEDISPVTYVSANPHSADAHGTPVVECLDEVWQYGWADRLGTVPPRVVTDRAIHHYRNGECRIMAHYIQPHAPLLTTENGRFKRRFDSGKARQGCDFSTEVQTTDRRKNNSHFFPKGDSQRSQSSEYIFDRLKRGDVAHQTVWEAYEETLRIVLEEVTLLLQAIEAHNVIITADHGNAFGEWGLFGHPYHMPFGVLREVPYIATVASIETDYEPAEYERSDPQENIKSPEAFEEKLRALGYVE